MRISNVCMSVGTWGSNLILTSYRSFFMIRLCSENVFFFLLLLRSLWMYCEAFLRFYFLHAIFGIVYIQIWKRTHIPANDTFLSNLSHSIFDHAFIWMLPFRYAYKVFFIRMVRFFCKVNVFEHWIRSSSPFTGSVRHYFCCDSSLCFFSIPDLFSGFFFLLFFNHLRLDCWVFFVAFHRECMRNMNGHIANGAMY